MSGIGTITAAEVFSERVELQPRTSDPSDTEEGEAWIRSDIAPDSNQIATLRVDTGGSTIDVPILQAGTATDGVVEALRLSVGSTSGYVPAIPESKAAFPALRLQHNGQVYGWHDARGETAFFDVAITATNSPVDDGETLTVDYSVSNTGGSLRNTQDIRLEVGPSERDRDSDVTVVSGASTTGQLSWSSASEGNYTASVLSGDDSASTSVSVESAIPDSGVGRLTFDNDDTSSGTALDIWNNNDGTINGPTTGVGGITGYDSSQAYDFDGTDDYVAIPLNFDDYTSVGFTFGCWINPNSFTSTMCSSTDGTNQQNFDVSSDGVRWTTFDGSTVYGVSKAGSFNSATTYFLVAVYDPSNGYTIYQDDATELGSSADTTFVTDGTNQHIGDRAGDGSFPMDGVIDDPRLYSKPLSTTEISNWYNTGSISG
jgi:hypothetical protein